MKLHLGCGQRYLKGYLNIDFPSSKHTVQPKSVADRCDDIFSLNYPIESIDEVRLHHVFEHFTRPVACALLTNWYSWLKPAGKIHIEVPNFYKTSRIILNPFSSFNKKAIAERHLFGSHEASWAAHCEGYTPDTLKKIVESFGFKTIKIKKNSWRGTYNFELLAIKDNSFLQSDFKQIALQYLSNFLVDESATEQALLQVWMDTYRHYIKKP